MRSAGADRRPPSRPRRLMGRAQAFPSPPSARAARERDERRRAAGARPRPDGSRHDKAEHRVELTATVSEASRMPSRTRKLSRWRAPAWYERQSGGPIRFSLRRTNHRASGASRLTHLSQRAIRSAIMAVVKFVGAEAMRGMIDASATNSPSRPCTRPRASTTAPAPGSLPI